MSGSALGRTQEEDFSSPDLNPRQSNVLPSQRGRQVPDQSDASGCLGGVEVDDDWDLNVIFQRRDNVHEIRSTLFEGAIP